VGWVYYLMSVRKLNSQAFDNWVAACIGKHKVFGVQAVGDRFKFAELEQADNLRLDYDVTVLPPKKYFQPPREALSSFGPEGFKSCVADEPFVLLGVHPYDMVAISQMDKLFTLDECDIHYVKRRENATIVVSDIQRASENSFAGCMKTTTVDEGFDILVTQIGADMLADARTEKGEALLGLALEGEAATESELKQREVVHQKNRELLCRYKLNPDPKELPALLEKSLDHPVWKEKAEKCLSCGSCNLVCPTCYCFDVQDKVDWSLECGERCRSWDACMLKDFAAVAGGHNFRRDSADRYRHRYYRKGKYVADKIGEIACVGCGRCITACTTNIANPVEIFNRLWEDK